MYLRLHSTNGAQINNPTNTIRYGGLRTGVHLKRSGSEYKNRYQNRADWKNDKGEVSAMRCQAIKAFLRDLWVEWRTYEGYTIPESYAEAHLGMAPHGYNEADMRPAK